MALIYDKNSVKSQLTLENYYELLSDWGGDPQYTDFGLISRTICHNLPNYSNSRKLYLYENGGAMLFHCYSGCYDPSFDIFELTIKVFAIQREEEIDLNEAVQYICSRFNIDISSTVNDELKDAEDWKTSEQNTQDLILQKQDITLKKYDERILNNLNYKVILRPWLNEGISQEVIKHARIGYFPGNDQITIPHFDKDNNFIGLRGRAMVKEDAEKYGKYRPIKVGTQLYTHPLGFNLYNLNNSKNTIAQIKKAIVFESEKSVLQLQSMFGLQKDCSVACCGSNLSIYQFQLLREAGAEEIVIAFDRQFEDIGTDEYKLWMKKLESINNKYKNYANMSFIFDKNKITGYKDSPTDRGPEIFKELLKNRITL